MNLSQNFTLEELTSTSTGLINKPDEHETVNLKRLAVELLQPIRDRWGALTITSGFRSWPVNSAVGGVNTSQHCFGEAADFVPLQSDMMDVFVWIVNDSGLQFGQCILEKKGQRRWIHISLGRKNRRGLEAFMFDGKKYTPYPEEA